MIKYYVIKHLIAKNPKYDGYQSELAWMVYKFFDKKASGWTVTNVIICNKELAKELRKPIIRKCKKKKHTHLL